MMSVQRLQGGDHTPQREPLDNMCPAIRGAKKPDALHALGHLLWRAHDAAHVGAEDLGDGSPAVSDHGGADDEALEDYEPEGFRPVYGEERRTSPTQEHVALVVVDLAQKRNQRILEARPNVLFEEGRVSHLSGDP